MFMLKKINYIKLFLYLCIILYVVYRIFLLFVFNFQYTDHDQLSMWYATASFAHFDFWQPRWFGGNKNAMIESILAVPFYWIGVKLKYALPIVTCILSLIPFSFLILSCIRKKEYDKALTILVYLSFMGVNYDLLSSAPRSFVSGLALMSIAIYLLSVNKFLFISGLLIPIAIMSTATSLIIITFVSIIYFLSNIKNLKNLLKNLSNYKFFALGFIFGSLIYYYSSYFYEVICKECSASKLSLNWTFDIFLNNFPSFNESFKAFSVLPIGLITICFLGVMLILFLYKKSYFNFFSWLLVLVLSFSLYSFSKVSDYSHDSFYLPQFRLFMYVPILVAIAIYYTFSYKSKFFYYVILSIVFVFSLSFKLNKLSNINNDSYYMTICNVIPYKINDMEKNIQLIVNNEKNNGNSYIIFSDILDTGYVYLLNSLYYDSFFSHLRDYGFEIFSQQIRQKISNNDIKAISIYNHDMNREVVNFDNPDLKTWLKENSPYGCRL